MAELRLNPFLVSRRHPEQDSFTCEDPLGNKDFTLDAGSFAQVVAALRGAVGQEEILGALQGKLELDRASATELMQEMIENGILVDRQQPKVRNAVASKKLFDRYGWSNAFYFHNAVRDYPFLDYAMPEGRAPDFEIMRKYLAVKGLPLKYKLYENTQPVPLEKCSAGFRFDVDLAGAFAQRAQEPRSIARPTFDHMMYLAFGQIGKKPWPDQGYLVRKTSPSGGARHPTEVYLAVLDLEDVPSGVYHYNVRDHGLDPLRALDRGALWRELTAAAPDLESRVGFQPRAVFFFTTIAERSMWRYRESRSYRVLFIDLGHILSTFRMVCGSLGVRHFVGQGIRDNQVERLIGVDGVDESALYLGAIA